MLYKDHPIRKSKEQKLKKMHTSNLSTKMLNDDIFEEIHFKAYARLQRGNLGTSYVVPWKVDLLTFVTSVRVILPSACFGLVASLQPNQPQQQTKLSGITNSFGKYKHLGRLA